jgi:hypothetical protein
MIYSFLLLIMMTGIIRANLIHLQDAQENITAVSVTAMLGQKYSLPGAQG